jgi:polyisoprenoid-binding protein YceI
LLTSQNNTLSDHQLPVRICDLASAAHFPETSMKLHAALLTIPLLVGCVEDVGQGRVKARVADPEPIVVVDTDPAGATWQVDKTRSSIRALGAKVTARHPIDFHEFSGTVQMEEGVLTALTFTIDVASLEADSARLTTHLKKEDFLHVEAFPEATFLSRSVQPGAAGTATHTVAGDLTIRGMTKAISFPATVQASTREVTASTEFVIDRQDFGITYPGRSDNLVQDNVVLTISLAAKADQATTGT